MIDSVLLIAFGGPTRPEEIRPFLANVTRGRRIPPERLEEVSRHYERIGGCSPINELTLKQAAGLQVLLEQQGRTLPVYVGMRNWHPFLEETLTEMAAKGRACALGIILSPFQTEASWERYQQNVAEARTVVGPSSPEVQYARPCFDHPRFIETMADRARAALAQVPEVERATTPLVFTAHSIPVAMAQASPYVAQFTAASRQVAERLGRPDFVLAYQSRSGDPREPWLEPDIGETVKALAAGGARHAVVVPIGFVADHVEVLYDLDVEARETGERLGLSLHRAHAANDHPTFITMLVELVKEALAT
jgi:ferrochelatase